MNATIESLFGPPSEPIDIPAFIQSAATIDVEEPVKDSSVAEECDLADIRNSISNAWNNPAISAYLSNNHDYMLMSLYSTTKSSKSKRKPHPPQSSALPSEVAELQAELDAVKLSSSKLTLDSSTFIRPSKISDQNVLTQVKVTPEPSAHLSEQKNAIITMTVHNRSSWTSGYGYINRSSQHVLLSSQTLGDIFKVMPCISNEIILDNESENGLRDDLGCVISIENTLYGDGHTEEDYAQKLLNHLQIVTKDGPVLDKASTTIYETPLSSLKLRINCPYWLLHKGNCEHFLVVDQIRLEHSADMRSGYPLTLQITPSLLDLCRACVKVPAALSIIGDIRLGESPCLLCASCWRHMGDSSDPSVLIKILPKFELGW